jgi:hypothetical protein
LDCDFSRTWYILSIDMDGGLPRTRYNVHVVG